MSLKEKAADALALAGMLRVMEQLPTQPGIVVFNHHRIGDERACSYDRGIFSASAEQFEAQIAYIKRHFPVLLPNQLAELIATKRPLTRMHAMITFDDGYLDNYEIAYKILRRHGVPAAFYLVSGYVGSDTVPWWDEIAYAVRQCRKESLEVTWCAERPVMLEPDREAAIRTLVSAFKANSTRDASAALSELRSESGVEIKGEGRRFLDWDEAREMAGGGMEIGAHTRTHPIISKLSPEEQREELRSSKASLEEHIGRPVGTFAYPNGSQADFTRETMRLVEEAGYSTAFSFYGGINRDGWREPFNLLRVSPDPRPGSFRLDAILSSRFGRMEAALRGAYKRLRSA
jgi:peptidoglycan/xylan/chitin deacetylase (PgdA/CDA1 family)